MLPTTTTSEIIKDDGSIERTITTVVIIPAKQYQEQQAQIQKRIDALQAQFDDKQPILIQVQEKLSTLKPVQEVKSII